MWCVEVLDYVVGSSWDACSGTLVLAGTGISLWGDPGNWFSLLLVLSLSPTQTGNMFLTVDVAFPRSLI